MADYVLDVSACSAEGEYIVLSLFASLVCHCLVVDQLSQGQVSSILRQSSE